MALWCKRGKVGALGSPLSEPPVDCHADLRPDLRPPPSPAAPVSGIWRRPHFSSRSGSPSVRDLAAIPRPNGGGEGS